MLTIGEFASIGRVTVRMLRHYDQIGLLPPAEVDPYTGYRSYEPRQLADLARIVQLRGLGLSLDDIVRMLRQDTDDVEARNILYRARQALQRSVAEDQARLARLDAFLRHNQGELMSTNNTINAEVRAIAPMRVATLTRTAGGFGPKHISPVVGPIFPDVEAALEAAGVSTYGPAVAFYAADDAGDGSQVLVTAGFVVPEDAQGLAGLDVHTLPGARTAVVATHHGDMTGIGESWDGLAAWMTANGYEPTAICREVYLTPGNRPQSEWVTELVQPVEPRS